MCVHSFTISPYPITYIYRLAFESLVRRSFLHNLALHTKIVNVIFIEIMNNIRMQDIP